MDKSLNLMDKTIICNIFDIYYSSNNKRLFLANNRLLFGTRIKTNGLYMQITRNEE